jgi:DNA-binding transcriptional ArsR family regulator
VRNSSPPRPLLDRRLIKAVANPTRLDILNELVDRGPSSPSKIARRLDHVSVNLVSHHIKVLRELGCVELVDEVKHGGRTERIYRANKRHFFTAEESELMNAQELRSVTLDVLRLLSQDVEESLLADCFDRLVDQHLSRIPLRVDQEGWEEVVEILDRALHQVEAVARRVEARHPTGSEELVDTRVAIMQFPMPAGDSGSSSLSNPS